MALSKRVVVISRDIIESGQIQVATSTIVEEDGVEISRSLPHRHVVSPGDDFSAERPEVQRLASLEHTPEVIAAYRAR